jgi:hypothetical protein
MCVIGPLQLEPLVRASLSLAASILIEPRFTIADGSGPLAKLSEQRYGYLARI